MLHHVRAENFKFDPPALSIGIGDTVVFHFGDMGLDVTSDTPGLFGTEANVGAGQERSVNFPAPGTFGYHCRARPGMTGSITVR